MGRGKTPLSKKDYGINGVHEELGRQIKDAEFRGVVITKLTYIEESLKKTTEEQAALEARVTVLEGAKMWVFGVATGLGITASFVATWLKDILFRGI